MEAIIFGIQTENMPCTDLINHKSNAFKIYPLFVMLDIRGIDKRNRSFM